jgi:GGDEF domain-containing protein
LQGSLLALLRPYRRRGIRHHPAGHQSAARPFAEGARNAFGALPIEGLLAEHRCSASFGVAELAADEGFADLLRRADGALYEAKNAGRDCVRVSGALRRRQTPTIFNGKG